MAEHTIPIENISKLKVATVGGNLYLFGWSRDNIRIKDKADGDQIKTKKDQIEIRFSGDGFLHIPHDLEIEVQSIGGDASIHKVNSAIKISTVGGDLTLNNVSSAVVGSVGCDLFVKRVQGDLKVEKTGGDALIDYINGQLSLRKVGGDIVIAEVAGGIEAAAGGEGTIDFSPVPWQAYKIEVGGNLSVSMPEESNADLTVNSGENNISLILGEIKINDKVNELQQQIGEGGPAVILSAGGKVFISGDDFSVFTGIKMNFDDIGAFTSDFSTHTAKQIKNSLDHLEIDLRESLTGLSKSLEEIGISEENLKNFGIQIEETSKMAAEKAELAAIKAQAKVEKKIARARRSAQKAEAKVKEFDLGDFLETQQTKKAVNESERLLILEMLQEKKISLDEADQLLKALEGKK